MPKHLCFRLLLLIGLLICAASCAREETIDAVLLADWQSYTAIRSDTSDEKTTKAFSTFVNAVEDMTGTRLPITTDWVKRGEDIPTDTREILIGITNRIESQEIASTLRWNDYVIKVVGNRLVIIGGSNDALHAAVEFYCDNLIDSKNKCLLIPAGDGYEYRGTYMFDKFTIDGVDIGEFALYNNSLADIKPFAAAIGSIFGTELPVTAFQNSSGHYIILDGTGLIADEYSYIVENGNLTIRGSRDSLPRAIEAFTANFLPSLGGGDYNLTAADNFTGSTGKKEIYTKAQLMQLLTDVYADKNHIIIGEQSVGTAPDVLADTIRTFAEATGEEPGILGIDLACYGLDIMRQSDLNWSGWICDIVNYCAEGGIVTASSHFDNPSAPASRVRGLFGSIDTKEGYEQAFRDLITEGTEYNTLFKKELDANARFLKTLGDNGVTVIWRPLHEANGSWFWFCTTQNGKTMDAARLIDLWRYIYDYYTKELGLDNLIWNHSPNTSSNIDDKPGGTMSTTYLYPGDEYCDMVGLDWYSSGKLEITSGDNYGKLLKLSGKIGAITEFGPTGSILAEEMARQPALYDSMDLYNDLTVLRNHGYSFAYLLTWTSKWSIRAMGRGDEFMQAEMTLGREDVKAMFSKMK